MREIKENSVCVIGGAGFLGSQLVDHLIEDRDCCVIVLDNLITGKEKHIHKNAKFIWYINATSVLRVLNACQRSEFTKGILQVSSAEIYGDLTGKIKESDPIEAHSTYGVSKVAADGLVQVRWREAEVPAIAMRQFNCVGERETHAYVIPEIISQLSKSNTVRLGNNSFRDFQYSKDAVKMAVLLLEKGNFGEVYNMGSESGILIYDLAKTIGRLMGHAAVNIEVDEARVRPWEIWHLQSDNSKLYSAIGEQTPTSLEAALQNTIDYFNTNNQQWDW